MKKLTTICMMMFAVAMVALLVACGDDGDGTSASIPESNTPTNGKRLVRFGNIVIEYNSFGQVIVAGSNKYSYDNNIIRANEAGKEITYYLTNGKITEALRNETTKTPLPYNPNPDAYNISETEYRTSYEYNNNELVSIKEHRKSLYKYYNGTRETFESDEKRYFTWHDGNVIAINTEYSSSASLGSTTQLTNISYTNYPNTIPPIYDIALSQCLPDFLYWQGYFGNIFKNLPSKIATRTFEYEFTDGLVTRVKVNYENMSFMDGEFNLEWE